MNYIFLFEDLDLLLDNGVIQFTSYFENILEKSQKILSYYRQNVCIKLGKTTKLGEYFD